MVCMLKMKIKTYPACVSKYISKRKGQIILLMISYKKGWHYIAVKRLSELLRRVTSQHNGDYYSINCLHSFRRKGKLESCKKLCEIKDFCKVVIHFEDTKVLWFN